MNVVARALAVLLTPSLVTLGAAQPITYQGSLAEGGQPADGLFALSFSLFDSEAGGAQVGPTLSFGSHPVSAGLFTAELDFGDGVFDGEERWLETRVDGTTLSPRTRVTAAPKAIHAAFSDATRGINVASNGNIGLRVANPLHDIHLGLPSSAGAGIFFGDGSGLNGTKLSVFGSNNQIFRINLDPNGVSGFEQFEIAFNSTPIFIIDDDRVITTPTIFGDQVTMNEDLIMNERIVMGAPFSVAAIAIDRNTPQTISIQNDTGDGISIACLDPGGAEALSAVAPLGTAAFLAGEVQIIGNLSKSSGSFKIDHPLEPAHKYLSHSFVESPDMKNIYDGVATLGDGGRVEVVLPDYFEALNTDFRYQLTCIGGFAPVFIEREISANSFSIAGGRPGLRVSWQVTGTRRDAFALGNPIVVEEEKTGDERGRYLYPQGFGAPAEDGIGMERLRR